MRTTADDKVASERLRRGDANVNSGLKEIHRVETEMPNRRGAPPSIREGRVNRGYIFNLRRMCKQMPTVMGIPLDVNSSYLRGAAGEPQKIREALSSDSSNQWSELGIDVGAAGAFRDAGDLCLKNSQEDVGLDFAEIERAVGALVAKGERPVSLGGDHSVTYPILKVFAGHHGELTIIHFDAHPDLYDEFEGSRLSHACPFARVMEEGLAKRLLQVGIRTINAHQREQATKFGVEVIEMRHLPALDRMKIDGPVYISIDMDALDPAFAPG